MKWRTLIISQVILGYLIFPVLGSPRNHPKKTRKPITLYGVERQRSEDNKAVEILLKYFESEGIKTFQYSSKEEMAEKVLAALEKGSCLQQLNLYGHGKPGILNVGNGQSAAYRESTFIAHNLKDWKTALINLRGKFCDGGLLSLRGCNVGADEQGARLVYDMAVHFNTKVEAPVNLYIEPGYTGDWQKADPKMTDPPRPKRPTDRQFRRREHRRTLFPYGTGLIFKGPSEASQFECYSLRTHS